MAGHVWGLSYLTYGFYARLSANQSLVLRLSATLEHLMLVVSRAERGMSMFDFRPPKLNHSIMGFCKLALPLELWRAQIEVEVAGDGLDKFKQFNDAHAVVVCNHSNLYDPEVMFAFSKLAGEDFHFVAAREVFSWVFGLVGLWFQSLGCYSLVRGKADYQSFAMTRQIITTGERKIVLFPEGEITQQPDVLLPLRSGALKLLLEGQAELNAIKPGEPVYILPIGIKWRYKRDIEPKLETAMGKIENKLRVCAVDRSLLDRARTAGNAMLSALEHEYFVTHDRCLSFENRVVELREHILKRVAPLLGVELGDRETHLKWLRRVFNSIEQYISLDKGGLSPFQSQVRARQVDKLKRFLHDCSLVQRLVGVVQPLQERRITQESLAGLIVQLEREVLGYVSWKGPRIARIEVGQPLSLLEFISGWQNDEDGTVDQVTSALTDRLQTLIAPIDVSRSQQPAVGA